MVWYLEVPRQEQRESTELTGFLHVYYLNSSLKIGSTLINCLLPL